MVFEDDAVSSLFGEAPEAPEAPEALGQPLPTNSMFNLKEAQRLGIDTVAELIAYIDRHALDPGGVRCAACTRLVVRYDRTITSAMARWLIAYAQYFQDHPTQKW